MADAGDGSNPKKRKIELVTDESEEDWTNTRAPVVVPPPSKRPKADDNPGMHIDNSIYTRHLNLQTAPAPKSSVSLGRTSPSGPPPFAATRTPLPSGPKASGTPTASTSPPPISATRAPTPPAPVKTAPATAPAPFKTGQGILFRSDPKHAQLHVRLRELKVPLRQNDSQIPDFIFSTSSCAVFISMQDHLSRPTHIQDRLSLLKDRTKYSLNVLLVLCDLQNNAAASDTVSYFNKLALKNSVTLILAWSNREAAQYLESYFQSVGKSADSIKERAKADHYSQAVSALTAVRTMNQPSAETLLKSFKSLANIMSASMEQLTLCHGLGQKRVQSLYRAFNNSFVVSTSSSNKSSAAAASTPAGTPKLSRQNSKTSPKQSSPPPVATARTPTTPTSPVAATTTVSASISPAPKPGSRSPVATTSTTTTSSGSTAVPEPDPAGSSPWEQEDAELDQIMNDL